LTLKQLLDEFCFGTYDFVYLNTGCNVGYAFINFVDTSGMIAMVDHIENRSWSSFRSAKAAECGRPRRILLSSETLRS
jgi:hypothetical protein